MLGWIFTGGAACVAGGFAFATKYFLVEIKDIQRQIREEIFNISQQNSKADQEILGTVTEYAETIRKLQQNHDNLLSQVGVLKCDVRDNRAALEKQGFIHTRAGYPEENIPKRTDWNNIEDA